MRTFALCLVAMVCLASCKRQSIVGEWQALDGRPFTLALKPDGKVELTAEGAGMSFSLVGTYTVDENRLHVKDLQSPMANAMPGGMAAMGGSALGEPIDCTYSWKNEREMVLSGNPILAGSYKRKN